MRVVVQRVARASVNVVERRVADPDARMTPGSGGDPALTGPGRGGSHRLESSRLVSSIGPGYVVLVGIERSDDEDVISRMARKIAHIRLFPSPTEPERKPIDVAISEVGGEVLAVSQFTLCADTSRGRRPSFVPAAPPEDAAALFDLFVAELRDLGLPVLTGEFGAHMRVDLINDGPVTIWLEEP